MLFLPRIRVLVARHARHMRTLGRKTVPGIFHRQGNGGKGVTGRGNSHEMRVAPHEMRQAWRPNGHFPSPRLRGEGVGGLRPPSFTKETPMRSIGYGEGESRQAEL